MSSDLFNTYALSSCVLYKILNMKMTSHSLSNFSIEANSSVKFDDNCDVIFMFKT